MKQLVSDPRRLRWLAAAVLAGTALFASGVFVANAVGSDGDTPDDTGGSKVAVGVARDGNSGFPAPAIFNPTTQERGEAGMGTDDMDRASLPWRGGCQVPLPAILADGKVDPAAAGFAASYLGDGFQLTSFTVRAEADCPDGVTPGGDIHIVVDTNWKHVDSGLAVYVSQRQDAEPTASVLEETTARFSRDGYNFTVNVDGYSVQPLAGRGEGDGADIARDLLPGPDPRAAEVLRAALASLNAPAEACFYTVREGTFDDLAAMGLGDPRGAIPAGYTLQDVQVRAWNTPAADCGTPAEGLQTSFNATWIQDGGFGGVWASAYSVSPGEHSYPGNANEYYANWTNGQFHFNVGLKTDPAPADNSLLRAIATALDPGFDNACLALEGELDDADLAAEGFGLPSAPDGYDITGRAHRGSTLTGDCSAEARASYSNNVSGNWNMTGPDGAVLNVHAYKVSGDLPPDEKRGYISDHDLSFWTGSVQYSISGYNERGGDAPSLDTLIEVARSIDRSFDPDSLDKISGGGTSPGGPPEVLPMPAEDKPR
jgi:hypothetical protein